MEGVNEDVIVDFGEEESLGTATNAPCQQRQALVSKVPAVYFVALAS